MNEIRFALRQLLKALGFSANGTIALALGISGVMAYSEAQRTNEMLNSLLFGVGAADAVTFISIVVLVSTVAFIAAWLSARRATRVDHRSPSAPNERFSNCRASL